MPGLKDQRQRERKGAAALCQKLDAFLPAAKQSRIESAPIPSLTLTLDKWEESQNVTEIAPASTSTMTLDTRRNLNCAYQQRCQVHTASCLRRLNNYMRASMGKSRLSSLALLHIHYANLHPRRLELDSLIRD